MGHILSEENEQILKKLTTKAKPAPVFDVVTGDPNRTYLNLLEESKDHDFIFGIKGNKLKFLKGGGFLAQYGSKGAGTSILLDTFIEVLFKTLECNIEMFSICFKTELKEAIKEVLDRYNIEVVILE